MTEAGVQTAFRAVLQPVTAQSLRNLRRQMGDLGQLPAEQFLYIGSRDISAAAQLTCGGEVFLPRRCEAVRLGDETLYYWGLAVKAGKEEAWTRSSNG
jgi:hypothetical protein